tara:strand:+ start:31 stop:438 length:408 start_codon:yes stop_codon:yes gene_type:complete
MKQLREHIRKEITRLTEEKYKLPNELIGCLKNDLKLNPLVRYVNFAKAVNSIPPSYEIFLVNGTRFLLIQESYSLAVEIKNKKYFLGDSDELALARKELNKLLTDPQFKPEGGGEGGESEEEPAEEEPAEEEPEA